MYATCDEVYKLLENININILILNLWLPFIDVQISGIKHPINWDLRDKILTAAYFYMG